ncbi:MAG: HAD family hydrolase [bacterium]|nr:HAD family hydrolase [bacterium]
MKNIVLDLDGTLLNDDKVIPKDTIEFLKTLLENDKRIILATARPPRGVVELSEYLYEMSDKIYYNGALVQGRDGHVYKRFIDEEQILLFNRFINRFDEKIIHGYELNDQLYVNGSFEKYFPKRYFQEVDFNFKIYDAAKILVDIKNEAMLSYIQENLSKDLRLLLTNNSSLAQIMHKSVSKYTGLINLLSEEDINNDTVCFGDDINDIELFEKCGCSVAMGNASESIKNKAKFVTNTNNENGVLIYLRQHYNI